MNLFIKHEVKKIAGQYEAHLYINKQKLNTNEEINKINQMIKNTAIDYIIEKYDWLPIRIVRIMVGSVPYFSFALNIDKEPYNLSKV